MEKNTYTIVQITGEVLEVVEVIDRQEDIGLTTRNYTFDVKEPEEIPEFIRGLIIE